MYVSVVYFIFHGFQIEFFLYQTIILNNFWCNLMFIALLWLDNSSVSWPMTTKIIDYTETFAMLLRGLTLNPARCTRKIAGFFSDVWNAQLVVFWMLCCGKISLAAYIIDLGACTAKTCNWLVVSMYHFAEDITVFISRRLICLHVLRRDA